MSKPRGGILVRLTGLLFRDTANKLVNNSVVSDDIETFTNNLTQALHSTALDTIPHRHTKLKMKHKSLPYWTPELTDSIKQRNIARNKFNRSKTLNNNLEYKRLKGQTQRKIKEAAKTHWENYCNTLNRNSKLASVWRMSKKMNGIKTNYKITDLIKDNTTYTTNTEKAEILANTLKKLVMIKITMLTLDNIKLNMRQKTSLTTLTPPHRRSKTLR